MPVGYHHFYLRDFKNIMATAGLVTELAELKVLEAQEKELHRQAGELRQRRIGLANNVLATHYTKLRPLLRPCHQKRFDAGEKQVEPELRGWL